MLLSRFYKENKELIDTNLVPLLPPEGINLIGGKPAIMYQKWAWKLVSLMEDAGWGITMRELEYNPDADEEYYADNWGSIYTSFVILGKMLRRRGLVKGLYD